MASEFTHTNALKTQSRLIKAMSGWSESDKPYGETPDGMFGRVAIIESNGVKIHSDELDFEFEVPFDDDLEANEAVIDIYNLSKTTIEALKIGNTLTITAGYKDDIGVIFEGKISTKSTKKDGVDKITTIYASDYVAGWDNEIENKTFKAGTSASTILKDLLNCIKLPIAVFAPRLEHTYSEEVTIDGAVWENIKKYAEVCGISVYVNKGQIYARYLYDGDNNWFVVSPDTGLIDSPEEFEEEVSTDNDKGLIGGYNFEMLLQHRLSTAAVIKLQSEGVSALCRVRSGKHIFNPDECITEIEALDPLFFEEKSEPEPTPEPEPTTEPEPTPEPTPEPEPEPEYTETSSKILLLYVGGVYTPFSEEHCNQIVSQSNATEYLLTTAYEYNHTNADTPILTLEDVDDVAISNFGTENEADIETIRGHMRTSIERVTNHLGDTKKWNYKTYVNEAVTIALRLVSVNSSCQLWFGLPPMIAGCTSMAEHYNTAYEEIINEVKSKMTANDSWGNVKGFYFGQEDLPQWYTGFNTKYSDFGNPVVKNMMHISNIVHGLDKEFLWIPYYRDDGSDLVRRVGHIINLRNIFDCAILQPSYYFDASLGEKSVKLVRECATQQKMVTASGEIVGGNKTSSTVIGAEMEIDGNAVTDNNCQSRYTTYVSEFYPFITKQPKRPVAYYADAPEVLLNPEIFEKIKSFFGLKGE